MNQIAMTLVLRSLTEPRKVARWLMDLHLSREALLTSFALVVVLNTVLFSLSMLLMDGAMPGLLGRPSIFAFMQVASVGLTIVTFQWAGRIIGGKGQMADMAVLVIWMQALQVLVQALLLIMMPLSSFLGGMLVTLTTVIGLWILVNFINEAHGFGSLLKSAAAVIFGVMGMSFVLSLLLALIGVNATGINGYV